MGNIIKCLIPKKSVNIEPIDSINTNQTLILTCESKNDEKRYMEWIMDRFESIMIRNESENFVQSSIHINHNSSDINSQSKTFEKLKTDRKLKFRRFIKTINVGEKHDIFYASKDLREQNHNFTNSKHEKINSTTSVDILSTANSILKQVNSETKPDNRLSNYFPHKFSPIKKKSTTKNHSFNNFYNYKLIDVIGKGSSGTVFSAVLDNNCDPFNHFSNAQYAIKRVDKNNLMNNPKAEASFLRELNVMENVKSQFVITVEDMFETVEAFYIVLPIATGDLTMLIDTIVGREDLLCFYAAEILLGIEAVHEFGYIYRDCKPENILVMPSGHLLVADFGLALEANSPKKKFSRAGTPGFEAPEMMYGLEYTKAVDVFSFGVTLYEMYHGELPFDPEIYYKHSKKMRLWLKNLGLKKTSLDWDAQDFNIETFMQNHLALKPPMKSSKALFSLLTHLLHFDPNKRLGCFRDTVDWSIIKKHKFFEKVDWISTSKNTTISPITIVGQQDHSKNSDYSNCLLVRKINEELFRNQKEKN